MDNFFCLMVSGKALTDQIRNILFNISQSMLRSGSVRVGIQTPYFEGEILTEGKTGCIGFVVGTIFKATVESETGKTAVTYIVRPTEMLAKDLYWVGNEANEMTFNPMN